MFDGWVHPVAALVATTSEADLLVHDVTDRPPPGRVWGCGRVTLAGDAAHFAAPTMGQGTCHAFEDAVELGVALAVGLDVADLRRYEASRARRVGAMMRTSHLAAALGTSESRLLCGMRQAGMRLTPPAVTVRGLRSMFSFAASVPAPRLVERAC
jgi:2-polyprenyl-6-methoxyphenol hydroxylase-like FAD-dependent oxidoreductase